MERLIANRYRIMDIVGQGAMGAVYQAEDILLQRFVAIKLITWDSVPSSPTSGETDSERIKHATILINEARMMARVQHPNIMPVYDFVQDDEVAYIVMPLLPGRWTYFEATARERPLMEIIRFLQRVADGLDFLHSHHIVHRDLKPDNILIDNAEQPYITDFGLAQEFTVTDTTATDENIAGTLAYLAPEVLQGNKATHLSDIFALGVMVYSIIAGHHPFQVDRIQNLVNDILHSNIPSIGKHRPELSEAVVRDIDAVIEKLTAKNVDERYQSASEAIDDLYRVVFSGQHVIEGKLFISYARKDQAFVHQLADELERYNVNFWIDRNIEYGTNWDESIDNELKDCDVMLVITTPTSMESPYVTYEWSYFLGANKPVFPFVPQSAINSVVFHPRLQRMQYIEGTGDIMQNVRRIIEVMSKSSAQRKRQQGDS